MGNIPLAYLASLSDHLLHHILWQSVSLSCAQDEAMMVSTEEPNRPNHSALPCPIALLPNRPIGYEPY